MDVEDQLTSHLKKRALLVLEKERPRQIAVTPRLPEKQDHSLFYARYMNSIHETCGDNNKHCAVRPFHEISLRGSENAVNARA